MANVSIPGFSEDLVIKVSTYLDDTGLKQATKRLQDIQKEIIKTENESKRFKPVGLNFLFMGMFIERTFNGILKTGMDTFNQITQATYGAQTAVSELNAGMTFLQFTIGDAINAVLEPLLPTILGIIDAVTEFIQVHPEVVTLAAAFAGLGAAMFVAGTAATFFMNVSIPGVLLAIQTFMLNPYVLAFIGIAAVAYTAWTQNWGGIRDFVNKYFPIIIDWINKVIDPIGKLTITLDAVGLVMTAIRPTLEMTIHLIQMLADAIDYLNSKSGGLFNKVADTVLSQASGAGGSALIELLSQKKSVPTPLYGEARVSKAGMMFMQPGEVITSAGNATTVNVYVNSTGTPFSDGQVIGESILSRISSFTNGASTLG